jgi:hypothetical protein
MGVFNQAPKAHARVRRSEPWVSVYRQPCVRTRTIPALHKSASAQSWLVRHLMHLCQHSLRLSWQWSASGQVPGRADNDHARDKRGT